MEPFTRNATTVFWKTKTNCLTNKNKKRMKKIIIAAVAALGFTTVANAQSNASGSAQQTVNLNLTNALEITFTGTGTNTGSTVNLDFNTVNDYASGVESSAQEIKVRSNKNFGVTVRTSGAYFSVTNNGNTTTSTMPTSSLGVEVSANSTGGSIASGFSSSAYNALSSTAANLIDNATYGGDQKFSVKYKATPGWAFPAGVYATDVIYTATQQ